MPVIGLNHYNLRASRELLERLRAFYCDVIGLRRGERPPFPSFGYWLYAGDNAVLHLSEARPEETRPAHTRNTFDHVAFSCADRRAVEAHLARCGVRYETAVVPNTGQIQLFLQDPAGNGIELNFEPESA